MEDSELSSFYPKHVGIIMDGNGRWAILKGKSRAFGHRAGFRSLRKIVECAVSEKLAVLTLYAFSSENWERPKEEVNALMNLFMFALKREMNKIIKNNIQFHVIGDISRFNQKLQNLIFLLEEKSKKNNGLILNIAANYGGRWDILQATKALIYAVKKGELTIDSINEKALNDQMSLADLPELDFIIRTGGEHRLSNFLLWQAAYAELYFTDIFWPDFDQKAFKSALNEFALRERRFGASKSNM